MKTVFKNELFTVIDDFLNEADFKLLWNYIQDEQFSFVHSNKWINAFRLLDGNPLWGPVTLSHKREDDQNTKIYPTNTGIDLFINPLIKKSANFTNLIGKRNINWDFFFARPYLYPQGTGLSWHTDGKYEITGAYVFYCHPTWNINWGAELLIDNTVKNYEAPQQALYKQKNKKLGLHLDYERVNEQIIKHGDGIGHFIIPKPNRLVVFTSGLFHRIKRVEPSAGEHVRASITGFFMNSKKVKEINDRERKSKAAKV